MATKKYRSAFAAYMCVFFFMAVSVVLAGCKNQGGKPGVVFDNPSDPSSVGIRAYPNAVPETHSDTKSSVDSEIKVGLVNHNLDVHIASFQTTDAADKVLAFYRTDLEKRYGDLVECKNGQADSTQDRTQDGLSCNSNSGSYITLSKIEHAGITTTTKSSSPDLELRAGTLQQQRIVVIDQGMNGTRISFISLDSH